MTSQHPKPRLAALTGGIGGHMKIRLTFALAALVTGAVISAPSPAHATTMVTYTQLGVGTTHSIMSADGVRSTLTQPGIGPEYPSGSPWRYYWVDASMRDGTFFQVGYADPALDSTCASLEWFVYAIDALGNTVNSSFGGCGTTGKRTFSIKNDGYYPGPGGYRYLAQMGSTTIGFSLYNSYAGFAVNRTGVISEIASFTPYPAGSPGLPRVDYSPALQVRDSSGAFVNTLDGHVTRMDGGAFGTPCPPYVIEDNGISDVSVYADLTPITCLSQGASLW